MYLTIPSKYNKGANMYKTILLLLSSFLLVFSTTGCGSKTVKVKPKVIYKSVTKVYIDTNIPLDDSIAQNIQAECALDTRLLNSIKVASKLYHIEVVLDKKASATENSLKLKLIDAVSAGNAFSGHKKFVVASGELFEGKKKIASFKVARKSGGGMFGGYKSSCAVLGGCTVTMAKDIAKWLDAPTQNAMLGDSHLIKKK